MFVFLFQIPQTPFQNHTLLFSLGFDEDLFIAFNAAHFSLLWESVTDTLLEPLSNITSPLHNFVFIGKERRNLAWFIVYFFLNLFCSLCLLLLSSRDWVESFLFFSSSLVGKLCLIKGHVWSHLNYINHLKGKVFA